MGTILVICLFLVIFTYVSILNGDKHETKHSRACTMSGNETVPIHCSKAKVSINPQKVMADFLNGRILGVITEMSSPNIDDSVSIQLDKYGTTVCIRASQCDFSYLWENQFKFTFVVKCEYGEIDGMGYVVGAMTISAIRKQPIDYQLG